LEEEHRTECRAKVAYGGLPGTRPGEARRRFGRPRAVSSRTGKINLSHLDSRNVQTSRGWVQGYNAQAVYTEDQIVIATEVTVDSPDFSALEPMIRAACDEIVSAGVEQTLDVVLPAPGYWHRIPMERLSATA
jgi:hypothetical protein